MAAKSVNLPKDAYKLTVERRSVFGRKVKTLRKKGILPANIYGKDFKSTAVQLSIGDFKKAYDLVGETGIVGLQVNGDVLPVLIHNVQFDPLSDEPIHADFLKVNLTEKVTATVPIEFIGESPAEKTGEGVVVHQMDEIEVEALPADLPEKITVDISGLAAVDDAIKVADLKIDKSKVEVKANPGQIVVNVAAPTKEEEVAPAPEVEGEAVSPETEGVEPKPEEEQKPQTQEGQQE